MGIFIDNGIYMIILYIIFALNIFFVATAILNNKLNWKWLCKMSWHQSPKSFGFDGCSLNGKCPRCGKDVLQDSQGNWY